MIGLEPSCPTRVSGEIMPAGAIAWPKLRLLHVCRSAAALPGRCRSGSVLRVSAVLARMRFRHRLRPIGRRRRAVLNDNPFKRIASWAGEGQYALYRVMNHE